MSHRKRHLAIIGDGIAYIGAATKGLRPCTACGTLGHRSDACGKPPRLLKTADGYKVHCSRCSQAGHRKDFCPANPNRRARRRVTIASPGVGSGNGVRHCSICGATDHRRETCGRPDRRPSWRRLRQAPLGPSLYPHLTDAVFWLLCWREHAPKSRQTRLVRDPEGDLVRVTVTADVARLARNLAWSDTMALESAS